MLRDEFLESLFSTFMISTYIYNKRIIIKYFFFFNSRCK